MGKKSERTRRKAPKTDQPKAEQESESKVAQDDGTKSGSATKQRDFRQWALGWIKSIALALVLWFVIQAFLIKSFRIDSGSMEPTLFEADFLFVNKAVFGAKVPFTGLHTPSFREPRRGELIVLRGVEPDSLTIVKRVIGVAGDTIHMRNDSLFRNGEYAPEPYAQHIDPMAAMPLFERQVARRWQLPHLVDGAATGGYLPDLRNFGPVVVPPDHLFGMGDNRDASRDGRHWGFLPRKHLIGHPLFIYFSYDAEGWRPLPFFTAIRWGRLFRGAG